MVTGGYGSGYLSSTEIYSGSAWAYAASLPSPRYGLSAATVDNSVFVFGLYFNFRFNLACNFFFFIGGSPKDVSSINEIFLYKPVTNSWTMAAVRMSARRYLHAVIVLPNIENICRSNVTSPSPSPAPAPATTLATAPAPSTTSAPAPAPATTRAPAPAPVTTHAPAPSTTHAPAPVTTNAPAPSTTPAPAPATTYAPAPATTYAPSIQTNRAISLRQFF